MPKTALVTGGSKRIGEAICRDLAAHGFDIAIHFMGDDEAAEGLAAELSSTGVKTEAIQADLTTADAPTALFEEAVSKLGEIDLLVNNASIFEDDTAHEIDLDNLDIHHAIHVRAPISLSSLFAKQQLANGGLIVNLIDQRVWRLNPNFFTYTLSKSTLWTATQTMAQAFAPKVRVNAIGPGPTLSNARQSDADFEKQRENLLLQSGPQLPEFGRTLRYLFETKSITGQMIALDGGQHLAWQTPDIDGITE